VLLAMKFFSSTSTESSLHIHNQPEIRLSCASFARITDEQGRYLLLVNKNRKSKDVIELTPVGGAIEATAQGKEELQKQLDIQPTAFEKRDDLRLKIVDDKNDKPDVSNKVNIFR
jgi:hypothetical protein